MLGRVEEKGNFEAMAWQYGRRHGITGSDAQPVSGVIVYRFAAPIIFSNAEAFEKTAKKLLIDAGAKGTLPHTLVIDCEEVAYIDTTGAAAIVNLLDYAQRYELELLLARVHVGGRKWLDLTGVLDDIGEERLFPTIRSAVNTAVAAAAAQDKEK